MIISREISSKEYETNLTRWRSTYTFDGYHDSENSLRIHAWYLDIESCIEQGDDPYWVADNDLALLNHFTMFYHFENEFKDQEWNGLGFLLVQPELPKNRFSELELADAIQDFIYRTRECDTLVVLDLESTSKCYSDYGVKDLRKHRAFLNHFRHSNYKVHRKSYIAMVT